MTKDMADRPSGVLRVRHLERSILSLACFAVPWDFQCRCCLNWGVDHMCGDLVRVGDWQWPWESSGKLSPVRVYRTVHLSDIHRLPTFLSC